MSHSLSILFVVDALSVLKAHKDSSVAMMRALEARGHRVWTTTLPEMYWVNGQARARVQRLRLPEQTHPWFEIVQEAVQPIASFDAVLMRKDPPVDSEFIYATYFLEAAQREGARVFNAPGALRDHNEKFAITEFAQLAPPTLIARSIDQIKAFHAVHQDIVVKPLDGMGGISVFRIQAHDPNLNVILETITQFGNRTIMAQAYVPEITEGDKRIILISGQAVPYALARIPIAGETRGNLAAGAIARTQPLSDTDRHIVRTLGPQLVNRGLLLVGIDVIGDKLTEINVTSPTGFVEIANQTGFDVAGMFANALEEALQP